MFVRLFGIVLFSIPQGNFRRKKNVESFPSFQYRGNNISSIYLLLKSRIGTKIASGWRPFLRQEVEVLTLGLLNVPKTWCLRFQNSKADIVLKCLDLFNMSNHWNTDQNGNPAAVHIRTLINVLAQVSKKLKSKPKTREMK